MNEFDAYFEWLLDQVMYDDMRSYGREYYTLLELMHDTIFTWELPFDANRADDGIALRRKFGLGEDIYEAPCSLLEMLIGLSVRMNDEIFDVDPLAKPARWFWVMMENCGLDGLTDDVINEEKYDKIVRKLLCRTYSKTGRGGLFPLKCPREDQRNVEIWYQMQAYVIENFDY